MAVVLLFDGVDDTAEITTPITNPCPVGKSIIYNGLWKNSGKAFQMFIDIYAGTGDFIATNTSGQLTSRINGQILTGSTSIAEDAVFKFEIARTSTDYKVYLDNSLQYTHVQTDNLDALMGFSDTSFESEGQLHNCAVGTTNYYDADASVHTAGTPVITDTIAGNNATGVNMPTAALGDAGSAWLTVGGGGISLTVTEVLNSFTDISNINIDYNVSAVITETLNSFGDTSVISVTSGQVVNLTVTETLNAFTDVSNINVSANIELFVTEVLNSFLDGANVTIAKDITLQVTEVFNSFTDNSSIRLPANWVDKTKVTTTYATQAPASTTWIDKG
jgi:hypothetical protein